LPSCLRAALLNRRKWDSGGDFGKPMHELGLPCPADPPKRNVVSKRKGLIGSKKQAESKAGQTHISGGGDTFMKSKKPCRGGLTNYE
jgi:hypothetical protein